MAVFFNQATLTYNDTSTNSNITTGELLTVLSATKTAVSETYGVGDKVTYVISILNSGTAAYTDLTVTDNLGAYTFDTTTVTPVDYEDGSLRYYVNGMLQTAPTVASGPPLVITGISVPAGGNAMLIYEGVVNEYAPPAVGGTVTNTATVSGAGLSEPITVEETITVEEGPQLSITKSLSPLVVAENGTLTYTFVIQNTGNTAAVATDNLQVTDTFDPILSGITVTLDGAALAENTGYTYNQTTGLFQTVAGVITVPEATFTQDATTGQWVTTPGTAVLVVTGTV